MKTKSIFLTLIAIFISLASMSQSTGAGSGSGAGNGSAGTTGAGRSGGSGTKSSIKTGIHRNGKSRRHSTHRSAAPATSAFTNNRTSSINTPQTGLKNTGGSYNTMPDNNDPGKETTSDKGKDGPH